MTSDEFTNALQHAYPTVLARERNDMMRHRWPADTALAEAEESTQEASLRALEGSRCRHAGIRRVLIDLDGLSDDAGVDGAVRGVVRSRIGRRAIARL